MQGCEKHISHLTMYRHIPNVLTVVSSKTAFLFFLSQLHMHRDKKVHSRDIALGDAPLGADELHTGADPSALAPSLQERRRLSSAWLLAAHLYHMAFDRSLLPGEQIHNAGMCSRWRAHVVLISIPTLSGWDRSPTHSFPVCQHPCMKPQAGPAHLPHWPVLGEFTAGQMLCLLESHSDRGTCLLARFCLPQSVS